MSQLKKYELDKRTSEDIIKQIEKLSKSYTPEWHFDMQNPDIGSVLGILYADQAEDNIKRYNELLEVYHAELVNMLGVSLRPAQVASTVLSLNLTSDLVPGAYIPEKSKFYGTTEDGSIIYETGHPIYVTSSRIKEIFMTSEKNGAVIPIFGSLQKKPLISEEISEEELSLEGSFATGDEGIPGFTLFDFNKEGIERNALLLYHSDCFDVTNEKIFMRLGGDGELAKRILKDDFKILYFTEEGFVPVENVCVHDDVVEFVKRRELKKVTRKNKELGVLAIEASEPINEKITVNKIEFSSSGDKQPAVSVGNGNNDFEVSNFLPFSDKLSNYSECFISHDEYFARRGALITVEFDLSIETKIAAMSREQEDASLKIIKRKPKTIFNEVMTDCYADEVAIEYLTEAGWRRLEFKESLSELFKTNIAGHYKLQFICPPDWIEMGATGRCIRFQLIKSDNCYMLPCTHHYPVIKKLEISYTYEGRYMHPDFAEAIYSTERVDVTKEVLEEKEFSAFTLSKYTDNAIYIGFSKRMEAGPVSLLFKIFDETAFNGCKLTYEYSSIEGFKPLQVIDKTETFAKTGQLRFMPPEDFSSVSLEGKKCFWIKISDKKKQFSKNDIYRPTIESMLLNVVDIQNIDTNPFESFYLDAVSPNISIQLVARNILDTDVWVNEIDNLKEDKMKEMLRKTPSMVTAEYDSNGKIENFFVKWTEVSNFNLSESTDRHYILDRSNSRVLFGDGVHVQIPRYIGDESIRVLARSCDGARANLGAGEITSSLGNFFYISGITNPFPAFGGSNVETVDNALTRAAGIIGNRRRLVTLQDYIDVIQTSSANIDKVSAVVGESVDGSKKEGYVSMVVLMKDFGLGTHSFARLYPKIRTYLSEHSELTLSDDNFEIVEPIGVSISVDIWLNKLVGENDYEVHEVLIKALEEYLSPVSNGLHQGWQIGKLPTRTQILMKLNSLKTEAYINRLVITGTYTDTLGTHECDLENIPKNKFFVVKSGMHKAHILTDHVR